MIIETRSRKALSNKSVFLQANEILGEFSRIEYDGHLFESGHQGEGLFRWLNLHEQSGSLFIYRAIPGDSTGDGRFDTEDLIAIFAAGEYEDGIEQNSTWIEGDWNGDFDFDSGDIIEGVPCRLFRKGKCFPHANRARAGLPDRTRHILVIDARPTPAITQVALCGSHSERYGVAMQVRIRKTAVSLPNPGIQNLVPLNHHWISVLVWEMATESR